MDTSTTIVIGIAAGVAAVGLAIGGAALATGGGAGSSTEHAANSGGPGGHDGEQPLTGADLAKAQAAALAKLPGGNVLRAESNGDGSGFHLLVQQPDGSVVMVKLDASFTVVEVAQGPGGRGGPGLDPNGPLQNHDPNGTLLNQDPNSGTLDHTATGGTTT
ncbi:MAG: hypothetical protein U0Q14_07195 [Dermatophilaceae bacterium]